MAKRHYTIFCDESSSSGPYFSNFYGGALVRSRDREAIENALTLKKEELNLHRELKWTKVTEGYLEKYVEFIKYYFEFVAGGRIKVRIMFTKNSFRPLALTKEQKDQEYFLLYYQMLKHSFGIKYSNPNGLDRLIFSILLDDVPDKNEKYEQFREHLASITDTRDFQGLNLSIPKNEIGQIDSKNHNILQGLDIILGSMHFRLNDLHKLKPEGARRRGKRTIAKEKLYKEINRQIRQLYPNFNIGISTGAQKITDRWDHSYRHWLFKPKDHIIDENAHKSRAPEKPT